MKDFSPVPEKIDELWPKICTQIWACRHILAITGQTMTKLWPKNVAHAHNWAYVFVYSHFRANWTEIFHNLSIGDEKFKL